MMSARPSSLGINSRTVVGTTSPKFNISIDIGTHASGFAYSAASDGDTIPFYDFWPDQLGRPSAKTRTALLYRKADLRHPVAWGWSALSQYADLPPEERDKFICLEHFKKYLMPADFTDIPMLPAGLTIKKLMSDFLAQMVQLIHETLTDHYGVR